MPVNGLWTAGGDFRGCFKDSSHLLGPKASTLFTSHLDANWIRDDCFQGSFSKLYGGCSSKQTVETGGHQVVCLVVCREFWSGAKAMLWRLAFYICTCRKIQVYRTPNLSFCKKTYWKMWELTCSCASLSEGVESPCRWSAVWWLGDRNSLCWYQISCSDTICPTVREWTAHSWGVCGVFDDASSGSFSESYQSLTSVRLAVCCWPLTSIGCWLSTNHSRAV
jgi:hypothetical protein